MDITRHAAPDSLRLKLVEEQVSALRTSVICAFNQLLDLKDLNTGVHSTRLAEWGMRVAQSVSRPNKIVSMHQILALMFLLFGVNARAQERPLSPKARELTQALAALRTSPDDSATQERYLKAFPHDYKEFLNLFEPDHELYDGHDFVEALSVAGKDHETDLGKLLVGLAKDAHYDADA